MHTRSSVAKAILREKEKEKKARKPRNRLIDARRGGILISFRVSLFLHEITGGSIGAATGRAQLRKLSVADGDGMISRKTEKEKERERGRGEAKCEERDKRKRQRDSLSANP